MTSPKNRKALEHHARDNAPKIRALLTETVLLISESTAAHPKAFDNFTPGTRAYYHAERMLHEARQLAHAGPIFDESVEADRKKRARNKAKKERRAK